MTGRSIRLLPYGSGSPLVDTALAVYSRVWPERDMGSGRETFTRYATYPDFAGMVAFMGDEPVGVGYGARSQAGVPWHDLVAPLLGADHPALQDAWRLVELAVVEPAQGAGIGSRLHDELLVAHTCSRALLSTGVPNARARGMYERRGWHYIVDYFEPPGEPGAYVIMGKELRSQ